MALLMPTADCKVTDVGAFKTALLNKHTVSGSTNGNGIYYSTPLVDTSNTFLRNEQLTDVMLLTGFNGSTAYGKNFNIVLGQYKSCTVSSATPAVVSIATHGYTTGDKVRFSASTVPTGMVRGLQYFVNVQTAGTFWIYDTYANAIAGGATGRVNTTSTGTTVVCHKVIEEKIITETDVFGNQIQNISLGTQTFGAYSVISGWTTVVDTTPVKWSFMVCTDDPTIIGSPTAFMTSFLSSHFACFGTATASAVSGTDSFVFSKQIDMTSGFTLNTPSVIVANYTWGDKPHLLVDPTQASIGNLVVTGSGNIVYPSYAQMSFGKQLYFTTQLSAGDTSATLTTAFNGVTGSYLVQLLQRESTDDHPQISMSFTNGSTAVTFSALSYNYADTAVVCMQNSTGYQIRLTSMDLTATVSGIIGTGLVMCGEVTKKTWTTLDAGIVVGASSLTTTEVTSWAIGDTFLIGGCVARGNTVDETVYTITNISTSGGKDTIDFTPTLATSDRGATGSVSLNTSVTNGINIVRVSGTPRLNTSGVPSKEILVGTNLDFTSINSAFNVQYFPVFPTYSRFYNYDIWNHRTSNTINPYGGIFSDYVSFVASPNGSDSAVFLYTNTSYYTNTLFKTTSASLPRINVIADNIRFEVKGNSPTTLVGVESTTYRNIRFWSTASAQPAIILNNTFGTYENIYIDNAPFAIRVGACFGIIKNLYLGTVLANTYDIQINPLGVYSNIELQRIFSNPTIDTTTRSFMVDGSSIALTAINNVDGETRVLQRFGDTYITGTGLSDTTLHNGNKTIKFRSLNGYYTTNWKQTVPTGNIQNKDMMIGIWVNINNSAYWAGNHEMPRLTINYDDGTIAYAEARQVTGWQYIFVPFTPTTTFGSITANLTSQTDATTTNADVYFADYSVLYPAGYTLNLGAFNNITGGFPVTPSISTTVSAQDVWAADPTQFGAGTVGEKVNKIKKIVTGLQ